MNTKYKYTQIEHFQCKAIKKGDKLFLPVTFDSLLDGGQVSVNTPTGYKRFGCFSFIIPEPEPKYDPCRPFKAGDEVRYCAPDGRIYADRGSLIEHIKNRDFTRVIRDELPNGKVGVFDPFDEENPYYVPAHALELVTPVEELEHYAVKEFKETIQVRVRNTTITLASFDIDFHPHAKEAAEAECKRLNEEYRKEKNNG